MKQEKQEKINGNKKENKENKDITRLIVIDSLKQEKEEFYEEFSFKTKTKIWF